MESGLLCSCVLVHPPHPHLSVRTVNHQLATWDAVSARQGIHRYRGRKSGEFPRRVLPSAQSGRPVLPFRGQRRLTDRAVLGHASTLPRIAAVTGVPEAALGGGRRGGGYVYEVSPFNNCVNISSFSAGRSLLSQYAAYGESLSAVKKLQLTLESHSEHTVYGPNIWILLINTEHMDGDILSLLFFKVPIRIFHVGLKENRMQIYVGKVSLVY